MYLTDCSVTVVPTALQPAKEEDPFSVLSYDLFKPLYERVRRERGDRAKVAIAFGNVFGGWTFCDPQVRTMMDRGPGKVSAFLSVAWFPAATQGRITINEQLKVPALTFSTEFYAFFDALRTCQFWLEQGVCDVAFAGAAETVGSPFMSKAFGPTVTHDAAVWFVLTKNGSEAVRLHMGSPPSDLDAQTWQHDHVEGSPIRGACALPLLALEARRTQRAVRFPGRGAIRANSGALDLWRCG